MEGYLKAAEAGKEIFPWSPREVRALAPVMRSKSRSVRRIRRRLYGGYHADCEMLMRLVTTSMIRKAVLPVLDGLYGGEPCVTRDNSKEGGEVESVAHININRTAHSQEK